VFDSKTKSKTVRATTHWVCDMSKTGHWYTRAVKKDLCLWHNQCFWHWYTTAVKNHLVPSVQYIFKWLIELVVCRWLVECVDLKCLLDFEICVWRVEFVICRWLRRDRGVYSKRREQVCIASTCPSVNFGRASLWFFSCTSKDWLTKKGKFVFSISSRSVPFVPSRGGHIKRCRDTEVAE